METVLIGLLVLGTLAFVGYPLVRGIRQPDRRSLPDAELHGAYADAEELELDFRTGKLAAEEYEALRKGPAPQADDELEREIRKARARRKTAARTAPAAAGNCPQCGAPTDPGDRFCAACGASLARTCRNCGAPYQEGDRFCVKCGRPV